MPEILENRMLVPNLHLLRVAAPEIAGAVQPGQFVILRVEEDGERIPLTVSDWDPIQGSLTLIYLNIGRTTGKLATLMAGQSIPTVVGPLGKPMQLGTFGHVVLVGGCYGIASIYPIARALKELGNRISIVVEGRSSYMIYWLERLHEIAEKVVVITRDGTLGLRGHINSLPQILDSLSAPADRIILNGCNYLMMRGSQESQPLGVPTIVSLNTLMIDGTGMCGVCRLTVASSTKFACVDGPHFDGHLVNWDELALRRKAYLEEEVAPLRSSRPT
jgi:ferredoxin/flavodoxin---NADP+ reductase